MKFTTLIKRNLTHFWRTNLAVILGVATAVAVLAGALFVGDSVRASLRDLVLSRLGETDFIINSSGFFRDRLATDLQSHDQFAANFNAACPVIALEGVVTRDENNARAGDVQVYGVDERFWKFHGVRAQAMGANDGLLSESLAQELGAKSGDTIILRIEKPSAIPVESLHGRKDNLGSTIRFTMGGALSMQSLGEFSLRPQQGAVRAVYIPLKKLQKNIEQDGKANLILLSAKNSNLQNYQIAEKILKDKFTLVDFGVKLRSLEGQNAILLETGSAVINDFLERNAKAVASKQNLGSNSILTYLANTIRFGKRDVPYSLITAIERFDGPATDPNIIFTDWAARDLGVKPGDEVTIDYYVWREEGLLDTKQASFKVLRIVPLDTDRDYAPEYPGITETKSLSEWDPPFPIDLSRVRKIDEEYWDKYRTTPKAFIPLGVGQKLWGTRYGKLTSIRFSPPSGVDLKVARDAFEQELRATLDPAQMGWSVQPVKEQSLQSSQGATDFGEYFTYFSFFLVISALLLTTLFFKLGIEQRLREIGLLRAIGYSIKQVRSLFLREGLTLAVIGSILGVIGAVCYGALMMWGLRTWWVGAVGTNLLRLHVTPRSLLIGVIAGTITALVCIWWTLRSLRSASPRSLLAGSLETTEDAKNGHQSGWGFRFHKKQPGSRAQKVFISASRLAVIFGLLGIAFLVSAAFKLIGQAGGFFGAGTLLLVAVLCFWSAWLRSGKKQTIQGQGLRPMTELGFRNASSRPGRTVLCIALIASAAFIIVSVDAFRRDGRTSVLDKKSGAGGYPLLAESLLPIIHDPNSEQGREELNLNDESLHDVKIARFRLRPGDDASCLNLYQPRNPRILAPTDDFIKEGRFFFQNSLAESDVEKTNPWLLLNRELSETSSTENPQSAIRNPQSIVPVIADANSMTYVLHHNLGDEITLNASNGSPVKLRLVAALADSIFQGELLMSEKNFLKYFPDQEGYRFFLIEASPEKAANVATVLEDRLSDFGFDAISTEEKLVGFHQVENTYLSTFQTLGGLGLLLGTLGLGAVLLRNVIERRRELALMRALGYQPSHLALMVVAENIFMLGCGLLTGVVCALLAIAPAFIARGGEFSAVSLGLMLFAVLITGLAASLIAVRAVIRSPLLPALRTE